MDGALVRTTEKSVNLNDTVIQRATFSRIPTHSPELFTIIFTRTCAIERPWASKEICWQETSPGQQQRKRVILDLTDNYSGTI